jgi:transcriptional regulator with XRE-family HTH domain
MLKEDYKMTFGGRLKELRESLGMSLENFAHELGTYKGSLSRYERDLRKPSIDFVKAVAVKYKVSIDWLSGKTDERNISIINMIDVPELKHIANGYIKVVQDAYDSGLTADEIRDILAVAGKLKKGQSSH